MDTLGEFSRDGFKESVRPAVGRGSLLFARVTPHEPRQGTTLLRAVFYTGGAVATAAGLHTVLAGARSLPGQELGDPSVESELRFYAAFYVAYGVLLLRVAPTAERNTTAVRGLAGALFLAGLARAGGWLTVGKPHRLQRALLVIELMAPPLVVAWQARLAERD